MAVTIKKTKNSFSLEKFTPILILLIITLSFAVGYLFNKVNALEQTSNNPSIAGVASEPSVPENGKLSDEQASKLPAVNDTDHVRGSRDAAITIIEYSDFECPFCSRFHPSMLEAMDVYGDDIAWVYRHFPLDTIHPSAIPAALASECVADLGGNDAFWDFTDYLFENQTTALSDLPGSAANIGLSASAVQTCMDSGRFDDKVDAQYTAGAQAGVSGTPGNFVVNRNGDVWSLPGAVPFETLKVTIDEALAN